MDEEKTIQERQTRMMEPRTAMQIAGANPQELLSIARMIDEFVTRNKWSWCDMERVYRVLKVIHGG